MIPKIAWFYWDQGWENAPRLRRAAMESFRLHNPEWKVALALRNDVPEIEGETDRARVLRSDLARYKMLAGQGGFYFDTDIIFTRPIPEVWLDADVAMSVSDDWTVNSVATLGSSPGNPLFGKIVSLAKRRLTHDTTVLSYQALGIKLWWTLRPAPQEAMAYNLKWKRIPTAAFLPVAWPFVEMLWSRHELGIPAGTIGVHWYGGDALSREFEAKIGAEGLSSVDCPVTRLVMANCPETAHA